MGEIKRTCQAERPVQVEVLAQLFMARIHDLNSDQPLPHYLSTDENPRWIAASELTPLAAKTRSLLREALDERFFSRYYKDTAFAKCDFLLEMQMKFHPIYKRTERSLDRAVILCCRQHNQKGRAGVDRKNAVSAKIRHNLLELLKAVVEPADTTEQRPPLLRVLAGWKQSLLLDRADHPCQAIAIDALKRSLIGGWKMTWTLSGAMTTHQKKRYLSFGIIRYSRRNRDFVDLLQCEEIPKGQHHLHTPSSSIFAFDSDMDYEMDEMTSDILANFVFSTSLLDDLEEEEEKTSL
ncbi:hypothetical protein PHYPSEUDO_007616 [Phytophthora pseudosyringae]|uniref:Uncharacterized protein n=1 Tax=Phytophthora pseudosyringae TaxID=221518 RepID=A0A8T1VJ47_9STRA|nr:hypothetical protein PHYPSEUDO_007616 [Phytophthora pseudosyringae]